MNSASSFGMKVVSSLPGNEFLCYDQLSPWPGDKGYRSFFAVVTQLSMVAFEYAARAIRLLLGQARLVSCLIFVGWLACAQPGTNYYGMTDPDVHARIDAEQYGQWPDGETLPGHEAHPPHEHPVILGSTVPWLTLVNPFGTAFYSALLSPARRLASFDRRVEIAVIAQSLTLEPPDQPPRPAA